MQLAHLSQGYTDGMRMGMDGGWSFLGLLFSLLVLGTIVGIVIYLVRALGQQTRSGGEYREPLDIARERYARGEITRDELAEIKKELK